MDKNNSNLHGILGLFGCIIFDIAIIIAYVKSFGLFFILDPIRSTLVLVVLSIGLFVLNGALIFPNKLFTKIGIPFSAAFSTLLISYAIVSNIFAILLITESIIWYIVWELIILAVFLVMFSIIGRFSNNAKKDIIKNENERFEDASMRMELSVIENILTLRVDQEQYLDLFQALKERIYSSTPFGRIIDNNEVLKIENKIKNNLSDLKADLEGNIIEANVIKIKKLIKDTQNLVIQRETLNIK